MYRRDTNEHLSMFSLYVALSLNIHGVHCIPNKSLKIHFDSSPTIIVNKNIQKHYLVMCSLEKHIYIINGHTKLMRFYMSIDEN